MNTTQKRPLILLAALLAAGVASAQVPDTMKPGEASTMSQGKPNPSDKSPMTSDTTRAAVKSDAKAAVHSQSGTGKGEATTTGPMGQPGVGKTSDTQSAGSMANSSETRGMKKEEGRMAAKNPPKGAEMAK